MNRKNKPCLGRRRKDRGFTLMEMMVVLGLIGVIAAFAMPAMSKAIGKAHITDAVNSLRSLSSQVEAGAATGNLPSNAQAQLLLQSLPSGYKLLTPDDSSGLLKYSLKFTPDNSSDVPMVGTYRSTTDGRWHFCYDMATAHGYLATDIPAKNPGGAPIDTSCP